MSLKLQALMMCYNAYREITFKHDQTDAEVLIKFDVHGNVWIAFRGSEHWRDWFNNFSFTPYEYEGATYHRGFFLQYLSLRSRIINVIEPFNKVYITGHSLGGALAQICNNDPEIYAGRKTTCITFASPKPGHSFKNTENVVNIVHPFDPVAYLPLGFNYDHQGKVETLNTKCYGWNTHSLSNYYYSLLKG